MACFAEVLAMSTAEYELEELERAYQVLGVPHSASVLSMRRSYRRLAKRWHPDLYPNATPAYAEANQMMRLINEAYVKIENAPLRYHVASNPLSAEGSKQAVPASTEVIANITCQAVPKTDRIEFWVRFVCGALLGVFLSLRFFIDFFEQPAIALLGSVGAMVGFGFGATRFGDRFWHSILGRWWFWR